VLCPLRFSLLKKWQTTKIHRVYIKFCRTVGKTATETFEILKLAFRDETVKRIQMFIWFSKFKSEVMSINVADGSGRVSIRKTDENVARIKELAHEYSCVTIHELANKLGISFGSCQNMSTQDLDMRRTAANFMLRLLSDEKQNRLIMYQNIQEKLERVPQFLSKVITGDDETLVYGYHPKKTRQVHSSLKCILTVFLTFT